MSATPSLSRITVSLLLIVALARCGGPVSKGAAERLVRAYDEGLVAAYRQTSLKPIRALVTAKELNKLSALLDLKASNRIVLECSVEALEVTSLQLPAPGKLVVGTRERWRYFDRPLDPGKPPGQVFVADMVMSYEFVLEGGRWKMDQGRTLSCDFLEPKGFGQKREQTGGLAGPRREEVPGGTKG